jgi:hypothetical protein
MKVLYFFDTENKVHTIFTLEKGGAIISDASLNRAKEKFNDAMTLARSVQKFLRFKNGADPEGRALHPQ